MKFYRVEDEDGFIVCQANADEAGAHRLEHFFNKSIEEINREIQENKYVETNNKKYFVEVIFVDFVEEEDYGI